MCDFGNRNEMKYGNVRLLPKMIPGDEIKEMMDWVDNLTIQQLKSLMQNAQALKLLESTGEENEWSRCNRCGGTWLTNDKALDCPICEEDF